MTRDVDGHLWKGRVGVGCSEKPKKRPGKRGEPDRLARHMVDEFTSQLGFMVDGHCRTNGRDTLLKVESLTRCSEGYRRDERPWASHVCSRGCRNEAASSMTARPSTTSSTLPIFSTSLPATTASPPLVSSSSHVAARRVERGRTSTWTARKISCPRRRAARRWERSDRESSGPARSHLHRARQVHRPSSVGGTWPPPRSDVPVLSHAAIPYRMVQPTCTMAWTACTTTRHRRAARTSLPIWIRLRIPLTASAPSFTPISRTVPDVGRRATKGYRSSFDRQRSQPSITGAWCWFRVLCMCVCVYVENGLRDASTVRSSVRPVRRASRVRSTAAASGQGERRRGEWFTLGTAGPGTRSTGSTARTSLPSPFRYA